MNVSFSVIKTKTIKILALSSKTATTTEYTVTFTLVYFTTQLQNLLMTSACPNCYNSCSRHVNHTVNIDIW